MVNDNDPKQAAFQAFNNAGRLIDQGDLQAAMAENFQALSYVAKHTDDLECARLLLQISLSLSDLLVNVRKKEKEIFQALQRAREVARQLGDKRNWALLNLHLGRSCTILNRPGDADDFFESGISAVDELGDDDIRIQSAEFHGLFHFLHGRHGQALSYLDQVMALVDTQRPGRLFNHMVPNFLGSSAVFVGQFKRAIGVMDSSWRRALARSDQLSTSFYQAHLGIVLLMAGKRNEACAHLDQARAEAQKHNNLYAYVWAQRALAYYHFLEDRPEDSYDTLKACMGEASRVGLQRPYYSFPWILELLFEYHELGYAPIPNCDFGEEMQAALGGINLYLRGAAHRIQARQARASGGVEGLQRAEWLLRQSENVFQQVQAPVELAKIKAEMACLRLEQGRGQEAAELAWQAWDGLSFLGVQSFPHELRSLIPGRGTVGKGREEDSRVLNRYLDMLNNLIPNADLPELLSRLVALTNGFFEAERGAIFLVRGQGIAAYPVLQTSYNLTSEEVESELFKCSMNYVHRAYRTDQPVNVGQAIFNDNETKYHPNAVVCLPFKIDGQVKGVLYHDNIYSEADFDFSPDTLNQIGRNLGIYVRRIQQYCRQMEERTLVAIRETTSNAQLDDRNIICQSRTMHELLAQADKAAAADAPVLILGETGVGKELLARRLHNMSSRDMGPFVAVNLSAIPEMLLESELFGHEKGAFTGAVNQKPGRMELANRGTLFVDEIGEIPLSLQVKLLRALEEKVFFRVGGVKSISSNFRLVAATNRDLIKEIGNGNFREDLYYRLNVVPLVAPPLRMRGNDILLLAEYFLDKYSRKYHKNLPVLTPEDQALLKAYRWPGNVRELQNVIERTVVLSDGGGLNLMIPRSPDSSERRVNNSDSILSDMPTMDEMQRRYIILAIKKSNGKMSGKGGACEILGMKRTTLYTRMKKLGISPLSDK